MTSNEVNKMIKHKKGSGFDILQVIRWAAKLSLGSITI